MTPGIIAAIKQMAHHGYGWEDICVRLNIRERHDREAVRLFVLKGTPLEALEDAAPP